MADPLRILSSPIRLRARPDVGHLAALVSADTLARWARGAGRPVTWTVTTLSGDLAGQREVERQLAREGLDRAMLGREAFVERVREFEQETRQQLARQLAALCVDVPLGGTDDEAVARAARTAFVRLYDSGWLRLEERVVQTCPGCETVVDAADAEPVEIDAEALHLRIPVDGGSDAPAELSVVVLHPELLPAAGALLVPPDHPAAGGRAIVPLTGSEVPVVADPDAGEPRLLVPAHDAGDAAIAVRHGIHAPGIIDADGVIRAPGPLDGLTRYAARAAARELLVTEDALLDAVPAVERAARCRQCRTVLVPRAGRHWFLAIADLEVAAADAVREGSVTVAPPAAREELLARAGVGGDWCLSHQVWAGPEVPVWRCVDCSQLTVSVTPVDSCGKCMGPVEPEGDVIDAQFTGAVWPLAAAGWPDDEAGWAGTVGDTLLMVGFLGLARWALPMAGLGLRLAGQVPFGAVAVNQLAEDAQAPELASADELEAWVGERGHRTVRAAMVAGDLDLEAATALVRDIESGRPGAGDIETVVAGYEEALTAGTPGPAVALLAVAASTGVPPASAGRLRALAAPLLGD